LDLLAQQKSSLAQLGKPEDSLTALLSATPDVFAAARVVAGAADLPIEKRLIGISLLGRDPASADADLQQLSAIFAPGASSAVQSAVVRSLARVNNPQVPAVLTTRWRDRPADVKSAVLDVLLTREVSAVALLEKVKAGEVAAADFDAARRQRLLKHGSQTVRERAAAALGESSGGRTMVVEAYRPAIDLQGDVFQGQKVFVQNCATCHKSGKEGLEIGPDLISVAGWPADAMLTAVFDPSRSAEPRYLAYTCTLDTGEAVYGIVLRETPAGVTMKGLDGLERNIPRQQIKSLECMNKSLMPEGMEAAIDLQQMADLMAFVRAQKP
jgi:putative heme-binding domain-containing protein